MTSERVERKGTVRQYARLHSKEAFGLAMTRSLNKVESALGQVATLSAKNNGTAIGCDTQR